MTTALRERSRAPAPVGHAGARRCACGGTVGPRGECDACRQRRLAATGRSGTPERPPGAGAALPAMPTSGLRGHDFARVSVEKQPGVAHGPGGTNKFADCPTAWKTNADAAARLGATWVANAITGLSSLPTPIPAPVAALLNRHFHTTYDKDIRKIVGHYRQIDSAINSAIDFECETECDKNVHAYVYSVWTNVHLCPLWFKAARSSRANTIVHELAHDAAGRDDEAYIWEPKYKTLSVDDAIDNADSYSHFAEEAAGP